VRPRRGALLLALALFGCGGAGSGPAPGAAPRTPGAAAPSSPTAATDTAPDAPRPRARLAPTEASFPEIGRLAPPPPTDLVPGRVAKVVDGATLWLEGGVKLRLVGVLAPAPGDPLGDEATAFLRAAALGQPVGYRRGEPPRDSYRREQAYVFAGGRLLNGELVRRGLAYFVGGDADAGLSAGLLTLEQAARADGLGLWSLPPPAPAASYVADDRAPLFHRPECAAARRIAEGRRVAWATRLEALDAGRAPCRECRP
jgi:micrococcal nuclease